MKERRLQFAAFLLLGAFSFVLYNWTYSYLLVLRRETAYCFFLFDRQFLAELLQSPGGLVYYTARFFSQFFQFTWLGALVIAALVVCFGVLLHLVLKRLTGGAALFCALAPCVLMLTALGPPCFMALTVGLIASVGPFLIYLLLPKGPARRVYALAALPALYLLSGGCFWLFALWVTEAEWLEGKPSADLAWKLLLPALAISLPVIAWRWLFMVPLRTALLDPTVFVVAPPLPAVLLYAYLALLPFWAKASRRLQGVWTGGSKRGFLAAGSLALLAVIPLWLCYNPAESEMAEYDQLYRQKRWDDILSKAAENPSAGLMPQFFTNCALCHKGKLLEEMFHYPQTYGSRGLILNFTDRGAVDDTDRAMYNSDLLFEMGYVNGAFEHAFDNLTRRGRTYENLSRMAECSLVNGNYETARKYAGLLDRTLFHRGFARRCAHLLADAKAKDEYFAPVRARLPTLELQMTPAGFVPPLTLVESHPDNRMAFDYLVAWCLLDNEMFPMLPDYLGHLKEAGYTSLPTHVQEALLVYAMASRHAFEIPGFGYDPKTAARFSTFLGRIGHGADESAEQRELEPSYGHTFMYYAHFVRPFDASNYGEACLFLGNQFRALGRDHEALAHYRCAVRLYPQSAQAHASLADLLKAQGRLDEAAFEYGEARSAARSPAEPPPNGVLDASQRTE